jgi:hypothetical protein
MNYYNIFDLSLVVIIVLLSILSYKKATYKKTFEYTKIFIIFSLGVKFVDFMAKWLVKLHIIKADTHTILILISFIFNIIILYFLYTYILKISKSFINQNKIKDIFAKTISFLEMIILVSISIFMIMQLYVSKVYLSKVMNKTYTYPKIQRFYKNFLNTKLANSILYSDTGTSYKEVVVESLSKSIK